MTVKTGETPHSPRTFVLLALGAGRRTAQALFAGANPLDVNSELIAFMRNAAIKEAEMSGKKEMDDVNLRELVPEDVNPSIILKLKNGLNIGTVQDLLRAGPKLVRSVLSDESPLLSEAILGMFPNAVERKEEGPTKLTMEEIEEDPQHGPPRTDFL